MNEARIGNMASFINGPDWTSIIPQHCPITPCRNSWMVCGWKHLSLYSKLTIVVSYSIVPVSGKFWVWTWVCTRIQRTLPKRLATFFFKLRTMVLVLHRSDIYKLPKQLGLGICKTHVMPRVNVMCWTPIWGVVTKEWGQKNMHTPINSINNKIVR
jgi:hypothetical protein